MIIDKAWLKQSANAWGIPLCMICVISTLIMHVWGQWQPVLSADDPLLAPGAVFLVEGEVIGLPKRRPDRVQFLFKLDRLAPFDHATKEVGPWVRTLPIQRIRVNGYRVAALDAPAQPVIDQLEAGQRWQFRVRFKPPRGLLNPGSADYEAWLYAQKIEALAIIQQNSASQLLHQPSWHLSAWRERLSQRLVQGLSSEHAQALLPALLVGDRQYMQQQHWRVLSKTGTQHLMAISGLHIGLLALMGYGLGLWLCKCDIRLLSIWPAQYWASVLSVVFATAYAAMAGFSIPTQRALLMVALVVLLKLQRRVWSPYQILGVVAGLILVWDARAVLDKGFWLSFTAVACIFWVVTRLPKPKGWRLAVMIQGILFIGLLPLTALWFGQVSIVAPVVNVVAIPVMGWLIVPGVLLWMMLDTLSMPNGLLLQVLSVLMDIAWSALAMAAEVADRVQHHLLLKIQPPRLTILSVWFIIFAYLVAMLPRPWPARWMTGVLLLPVLFPPTADRTVQQLNEGEFTAYVLDVGQGLATVVRTQHHMLLYDTANAFPGFDLGAQVVAPFIKTLPHQQIDLMLLSHMDRDHAGGAAGVLSQVAVADIMVLPEALGSVPGFDVPLNTCQAGHEWVWDGVQFSVLYPLDTTQMGQRNLSCVVQVVGAEHRLLLTGDIDQSMESELRQAYPGDQLAADVMLVPHHGSHTSSSSGLIQQVRPLHAIVSAGWGNRFGHPNPEVERRYLNRQVILWNTAEAGMLQFDFKVSEASGIRIGYSRHHRWPWRFNAFQPAAESS